MRRKEVAEEQKSHGKLMMRAFGFAHAVAALVFALAAVILLAIAVHVGWSAFSQGFGEAAALALIEALGIAAVAVVALQIAQTIAEEEVIREAHVSAPTRVRRFVSRFLVVVVVAMSIEGLIATFKALHEDMSQLLYAGAIVGAVGFLLVGWGAFIWFNRAAEELEPEAMEQAKREDRKLG